MTSYVLLLRGINVGGRNSLPMKTLTRLLEDLGCREVKSYIQSGNVVLRSDAAPEALSAAIPEAIHREMGFQPHVLILARTQFDQAMTGNPYPEQAPDSNILHVGFLDEPPPAPDVARLEQLKSATEAFALRGPVFYLLAPDGIGRSKLAASCESLLGRPMTLRNWRTVCRIRNLLDTLDG